jgi:hypothetical protein
LTKTSVTTPPTPVPMAMSSVLGSTMPAPAM